MQEGYFGYRILLVLLILSLNAFFAAAEVSLVSVRPSRLRALADEGVSGAQAALNLLANPERLLSVTQVGVTLASLGLGWAGEETIFEIVYRIFVPVITPSTEVVFRGASFAFSFLLMSYAHVVIGEVVPKNLAIEKADRLAVLVAPALLVFYRVSAPFVYVVERSASAISRLAGVSGESHSGGHSPEELRFIISSSRSEGHLIEFEEEAIHRLLKLKDYSAREIMVPRNEIISIPVTANLDAVLKAMNDSQYSRLPVYEGTPEQIVGLVHFKDMVRIWLERRAAIEGRRALPLFQLRRVMRKALVVPETKALNELVNEFRARHTHMAVVVDEFGTVAGLVTLEDVLEQVFGEIEDEHDLRRPRPMKDQALLELEGSVSIRDLESQYGIELPGDAGFETLAGFLLLRLGNIPKPGERVEYGGRRFTIVQMERNRIARVSVEKLPESAAAVIPG